MSTRSLQTARLDARQQSAGAPELPAWGVWKPHLLDDTDDPADRPGPIAAPDADLTRVHALYRTWRLHPTPTPSAMWAVEAATLIARIVERHDILTTRPWISGAARDLRAALNELDRGLWRLPRRAQLLVAQLAAACRLTPTPAPVIPPYRKLARLTSCLTHQLIGDLATAPAPPQRPPTGHSIDLDWSQLPHCTLDVRAGSAHWHYQSSTGELRVCARRGLPPWTYGLGPSPALWIHVTDYSTGNPLLVTQLWPTRGDYRCKTHLTGSTSDNLRIEITADPVTPSTSAVARKAMLSAQARFCADLQRRIDNDQQFLAELALPLHHILL